MEKSLTSQLRTLSYPTGEVQRVQILRWENWDSLDFLFPEQNPDAIGCFSRIYRKFLVPACPWLFGNMVLFCLPEDIKLPFSLETGKFGRVSSPLTAAAAALEQNLRFRSGHPVFRSRETEVFYRELENRGCLQLVRGRLPVTTIIPVGNSSGFLTQTAPTASMKVNASFFIMDRFDCATVYDHLGTPLGLCIKNGRMINPPLYRREALLVKQDGTVCVTMPDLRELAVEVGGVEYRHGKNARIYTRPENPSVFGKGKKLVIVGCQVAAVVEAGSVPVPASGFVLCPEGECRANPGDRVVYRGMEDVRFGIQVGNSILRDGEMTRGFRSRFYNIRHLEPVPYPPSLYPMNFKGGRAARIALGADREGKPMLLWAEGAAKLGYVPGTDSCGASLWELGKICEDAGMWNGVNLDGGGSAQILLGNGRALKISDRKETDHSEAERPVPLGLVIR